MAADIELVSDGMSELLRSRGVMLMLGSKAAAVAAAAGEGIEYSATVGRRRAMAMVWTETLKAMVAEATERRLTRAIDAARL